MCVHRVRKDNLTSCNSGVNMEDVDCGAGVSSSLSHNRPSSVTSNSLSLYQHRTRASPHRRRHHNTGTREQRSGGNTESDAIEVKNSCLRLSYG